MLSFSQLYKLKLKNAKNKMKYLINNQLKVGWEAAIDRFSGQKN